MEPIYAQVPIPRAVLVLVVGCVALIAVLSPPLSFPDEELLTIPTGTSVEAIANMLHETGIIRSPFAFRVLVRLRGADHDLQAGDYFFTEPHGLVRAVSRMRTGDFGLIPVRVQLAEGTTRTQMAARLEEHLPYFNGETFLAYTEGKEGYLFPDTYFFLPNTTADEVADQLEDTFYNKTAELRETIATSSLDDIVTIASIIEREAHDPEDRRLISGVLWNRLDIDMPLQVDATLFFLLGKPSSELTQDDLDFDSPYNTYLYPGLPPGPIASPGLDAMAAALDPTPSDYLYYLSDSDGVTYFATTFEEHKENRALYLD
jgi:UPF0755 protein